MIYYLKLGNNLFKIETPETFVIEENIRHFFIETSDSLFITASFNVYLDEYLTIKQRNILFQDNRRIIFEEGSKERRIHFFPGTQTPFAYYKETSPNTGDIHLLKNFFSNRIISLIFIELLALEKYLLLNHALVFHSSFIIYQGNALLFSAPSGTGKSTQAELWRQYKDAQIINGDRSIIQIGDNIYAHGLPFCGSSGINRNESAQLAGIVLLEQAHENSIQKCTTITAVKKIYSECSINYWNRGFAEKTLDLIGRIVENVPVYHLKCTISEDAVNLVHDTIFGK